MHRWFFANEREECQPPAEELAALPPDEQQGEEPTKEIVYTDWPFCVRIKMPLQGNEHVAISGNCDELGNWDPKLVYIMDPANCTCAGQCSCRKFESRVRIPRHKDIEYRYCIVGYDPLLDDVLIRFWEVMPQPRVIRSCHNMLKRCEHFGLEQGPDAVLKVDRGWATTETFVQFKIFNAPFIWLKQTPRLIYVYMQPMYETEPPDCGVRHLESLRLSTAAVARRRTTMPVRLDMQLAYTEVANLRNSCKLRYQPPAGACCGPADLQLFHCTLRHPRETIFRLDLYTFAYKCALDEPPYHYGYGFIQPEQLIGSEGQVRVKITCASTHRPLIEMNLTYLIIRPLESISCNLSVTYERFWREAHLALDIGHRGTGNTYRLGDNVHRENTLFSFKRAALHHADMVELDVHLTKDAQVVVYHDFVLRFALGSAWGVEKLSADHDVMVFPHEQLSRLRLLSMGGAKRGEHIVVPLQCFNYDELRLAQPLRYAASDGCSGDCDRHLESQLPFPLLSDVFDAERGGLPEQLGIIVELKWPQQDSKRRWQDQSSKPCFDRNFYVDTVLDVVFRLAGKRRIVFSSFNADICIMIRYKQNYYPVVLLLVDPEQPIQFLDQRVNRLEYGAFLAYIMEFFGLSLHTNTMLTQPLVLGLIRDLRMQSITWGMANSDLSHRDKMKRYGCVGVTYDRIDQRDQVGEEMLGFIYFIDSLATRNHIRNLLESERQLKCARP